jgi:hypothetical protein
VAKTSPHLLILAIVAALCGCSPSLVPIEPSGCGGLCSADQICDPDLDGCVDAPEVGRGTADLAPDFDVAWLGEEAGVVAYDRLNDRLLYGTFGSEVDAELTWTSPLVAVDGSQGSPALALVASSSGPAIYLGLSDGSLIRGRLFEGGWQWEELASLGSPVVALEALFVPEVGHHIVAATEGVDTFFIDLQGGDVLGPEAIVDAAGEPQVQPPFALVRLAGRTTLLAGGIAGGLVSLSRESPGWTSHLMVEDVDVAAVGLRQTPVGVLALYLDRKDGGLYQVIEDDVGTVVISELASGVRAPGNPGTPVRIALAGGSGEAFVLYHDVGAGELRYLRSEQEWAWSEVYSSVQTTSFLPALVANPDGAPLPAGIDLGEGAGGPGHFELLPFAHR